MQTDVDTERREQDLIHQQEAMKNISKDMSIDEFEDTTTLASLFTDENVAVQLAATAREHAEILQNTQPEPEAY